MCCVSDRKPFGLVCVSGVFIVIYACLNVPDI